MMDIFNLIFADPIGLITNFIFVVMTFLIIIDKQKPPVITSVVTGILLIVLALGGSYREIAPATMVGVNGILWLFLAYQRWNQK